MSEPLKSLDRWIPRTYIEGRITYAFVEAVHGVTHDKENVELALGYFCNPVLEFAGLLALAGDLRRH
jgi:hypothetical protein